MGSYLNKKLEQTSQRHVRCMSGCNDWRLANCPPAVIYSALARVQFTWHGFIVFLPNLSVPVRGVGIYKGAWAVSIIDQRPPIQMFTLAGLSQRGVACSARSARRTDSQFAAQKTVVCSALLPTGFCFSSVCALDSELYPWGMERAQWRAREPSLVVDGHTRI